jgi:uncharacterized surface protein with fasciclin (FAS1) repeats
MQISTLVTAVTAAGWIETLSSEVLQFSHQIMQHLQNPEGTVEGLLKPESLDKLKAVLTYHVVAGKFG